MSQSTVTVRYWAAARAAATVAEEERPPGKVSEVLSAASADHPDLVPVLAVASILLNGMAVTTDDNAPAGSLLEVLPPFAGG
ncbi:hypothetical protein KEM60_00040 [Austwickia sp. TVS 96-490-7B]|uniref:MoaD/ThiS family protein n=1 Tax=Austwickia sp. TVS 96-490-7B TaxID=2830843 RepID=UPI001E09A4D0|nr:MoaD/ThiS family protein [Austwickia sp. TVS 96-490-7B]MBW3083862.1 hypothetical protein [Austwickia sp. TVS 96-490-7B]